MTSKIISGEVSNNTRGLLLWSVWALIPLGFGLLALQGLPELIKRIAILAATTGVVAASVISMGLISLSIMLRYGYVRRVAAGTIAHLALWHRSSRRAWC